MLRGALGYNPWQLGEEFWKEVASDMRDEFNEDFSPRAMKCRVELLIDKYKKDQFKYSSGTEEEKTERGRLLEAIVAIKEEESTAINNKVTPEDPVEEEEEQKTDERPANTSTAKNRKLERSLADKERETYADEAPGPSGSRGKRQRLSVEDEVILEKHKHDMAMEKEKMEIEKLRLQSEQRREDQRLQVEQQREERLKEESRRRDEIAKTQVDLQSTMLEVMRKFIEK